MLADIAMLAASGLSVRAYIRILPDLIRRLFQVDTVGFFWCTENGDMVDAYVEEPHFLSAEVLHSCQSYQEERADNWPSFTENVLAGSVTGYLLPYQTPEFYGSHHFSFTYDKIHAYYILDAVVHDGTRPYGCFLLMRSRNAGPFSKHEIALAHDIAKLMIFSFAKPEACTADASRHFESGLIMLNAKNVITYRNRAAHQSLWMIAREGSAHMLTDTQDSNDVLLNQFCHSGIHEMRVNGSHEQKFRNSWGDFIVKYDPGEVPGSVMIQFRQAQAFACHVALRLAAEKISPRRIMICWLLLSGLSRKEIAWRLGIGLDTTNEHIACLFAQLGVISNVDLMRHFSN